MFRILRDAPLSLGFLTWRFTPGADALVLVVKGTYRLEHGGRAAPASELEPVCGDVYTGGEPGEGGCRYASDVVPFKPRADAMLVGKAHTPEGRAIPRCSASFSVGDASLSLLVSGDRYWIDPALGVASEPRPFTEMEIGYERAFGGPEWAANPAGKGMPRPDARTAIERPLPNVEDPRELVKRATDRPAPAGFGPLAPDWAHRASKWPSIPPGWVEERWPWPPDGIDYGCFNAAQPALQIDGYLRGDERIACENLHRVHRRYECELPRVRPRAFVLDRGAEGRFREVGLRLDTLWVDMEAEKLVLAWRGSAPVESDDLDEIACVYLTAESLDEGRAPLDRHRARFELLRMEAEAPVTPAANDDVPAAAPAAPEPAAPKPGAARARGVAASLLPASTRATFERMGVPSDVLAALDGGDLASAEALVRAKAGVTPESYEALVARSNEVLAEVIAGGGGDPTLLAPRPEKPRSPAPAAAPGPAWTRARVEACLLTGTPLAGADLSSLDLSDLDLRGRDLTGCTLRRASLVGARLDEAILSGANLSEIRGDRSSFRAARLDEADLTGAALPDAVLSGADLAGAVLDDAVLAGSKLDGCKAKAAYLRRADLRRATLSKGDLREAHLDGACLDGADLRGADLSGASAEGASGEAVDLRGATLVRLNASEGSRLTKARLEGCRAARSSWMSADLQGADLTRCDLRGADLSRANLAGARLAGTDCAEADFTRSDLRGASLAGANLAAARMESADLRRADLRGASLYQAQLWRARLGGAALDGAFTAGTLFDSPVRGWAR